MSLLSICNTLFAVGNSRNIWGRFEICVVLFALLSQEISGRESFVKDNSAESIFPKVSDTNNLVVSLITFLSKMTLRFI